MDDFILYLIVGVPILFAVGLYVSEIRESQQQWRRQRREREAAAKRTETNLKRMCRSEGCSAPVYEDYADDFTRRPESQHILDFCERHTAPPPRPMNDRPDKSDSNYHEPLTIGDNTPRVIGHVHEGDYMMDKNGLVRHGHVSSPVVETGRHEA